MDRALYVAMNGAIQTLRAQTANSHNLANASTTGFKAELLSNVPQEVNGPGLPTRSNPLQQAQGFDASAGGFQHTGRDLDVAFGENLWLAVQAPDGSEGYTRAGDLQIDTNGQLRTGAGLAVMGEGGPMSVPPHSKLLIGGDGTVSIVPLGQSEATQAVVGRLRVVEARANQIERGADGLMRVKPGETLNPAPGTVLVSGGLEASNVNIAEAMVNMIQLARHFEMQVKLMRAAEENAQASASLMRLSG